MSLLTQFYNCPSNGGGGGGGGGGGAPYIVLGGMVTAMTGADVIATNNIMTSSNSNPFFISSITGGNFGYAGFYSMVVGSWDPPGNVAQINLSGSSIGNMLYGLATSPLTSITGTGWLGTLLTTGLTSLVSISTDIQFALPPADARLFIQNAKLDAATVNHILTSLVNNGALNTTAAPRIVDLSLGTSAGTGSLTAAGTSAVTALTGAGWTVTLNP